MQLPQDVTIPLLVGGDRPSVLVLEPLRTEKPLPAVEGDQAGDLCSHSPCLTDFFHLSLAPEHVVLSLDLAVEVKMSLICKPDVADLHSFGTHFAFRESIDMCPAFATYLAG